MNHLVITTKCNNNCINCINSFSNRKTIHPLKFYQDNVDKIRDNEHVSIGGGEPTLHPEFFDIIEFVNNLGIEYTLLTNARAFSVDSFFEKFDLLNLDKKRLRLATAIYGYDEKTHDFITNSHGSFEQTIKGIRNLYNKEYKVEIRIIITKQTIINLNGISDLICEIFPNVERISIINAKITGEAFNNKEKVLIKYSDFGKTVLDFVDKFEKNGVVVHLLHFPHCLLPKNYWKNTRGKTINDNQLYFMKECEDCSKYENCSGIWKSYYDLMGDEEFKKI